MVWVCISEQVGFFHDANELFLVNFTITVPVSLVNHLLQLLIAHSLAKLPGYALEVLKRDFSSGVIIEETESLEDFFTRIALSNLASHELHEVTELDDSFALTVNLSDHLFDLLLLGLKAEGAHGNLEFLGVDVA